MAHPMTFTITITGKGGHGSQPQFAVDPVLTAAHVVVALQSVVSRSVPSGEQAVVSVCTINGGETFNVIPDQVTMTGTTRDLKPDTCKIIADRMRQIVAGVCATFGATGEITFVDLYPVVENHSKQAEIVRDLGCRLLGEDGVTDENLPIMGAEDFSYFLQKVPGAFFFFGGREASHHGWAGLGAEGQRSNCMCHNTAFDFNDNVSPIAAVFFLRLVEERFGISLYDEAELPLPLLTTKEGADGADGAALAGPIKVPPAKKARAK